MFKCVSILLLFLVGCTHVPRRDMAELYSPVPLELSTEKALARDFFEEGGWPTEQWWEMFGDPQLNLIMELALKSNPTLLKAREQLKRVEQEAKIARASLFPYLDAEYLENWQYLSKYGFDRDFFPMLPGEPPIAHTVDQIDLTLNFSYEFDFFGKNRNTFLAALGRSRAQSADTKQATLMITTLIAQTYVELQTKLAQRQVLQDQLDERKALYFLTRERNKNGIDNLIPVYAQEQNFLSIEQSISVLNKEISIDKHALSILAGMGPDEEISPQPMNAAFENPFPLPQDLSSDLLARRPDLMAQIWLVEAAAREIKAAKADFYPRINLMAFAGLESLAFSNLFKIASRQGALQPAVHLPIFTGGELTANLKSKVAAFNEATYGYNEMLLQAAKEVADQIVTLTSTFDVMKQQIAITDASQKEVVLQYKRYKNGIDNLLSALQLQDQLQQQLYQLYGSKRDYLFSVVMLIKALGGGYHANMTPKRAGGT
jgi:NodT family efflux transporter outer membrane factor (OMF) lipoprotein